MSADGNPPTVYEIYGMRTEEEIFKEFPLGNTFDETQKAILLEVLLDIRKLLLLKP
jgi:hypothetical protein